MSNGEIYLIDSSDYWYVGSTTRGCERRFKEHIAGYDPYSLVQAKIQELGAEAFSFTVVEVTEENPIEVEQRWYDWYLANDPRQTLNGRRPGLWDGWNRGKSPSLTTRAKQSIAMTGKPGPRKGKTLSAETRAKISASLTGKTQSNETRAKRSAALKGHSYQGVQHHTEETKAKISASLRARRGVSS
jgi:hypothetical protein